MDLTFGFKKVCWDTVLELPLLVGRSTLRRLNEADIGHYVRRGRVIRINSSKRVAC